MATGSKSLYTESCCGFVMIIGSDFDGVIADDTFARISYVERRYGVDIKADEIHGSELAMTFRPVRFRASSAFLDGRKSMIRFMV